MKALSPLFASRRLWLPLALSSLLVACGGPGKVPAGGASGAQEATERPAVTVEVATAALRPIRASYHATAALEAPNEAQVVSKTSGVLLKLLVEEGDTVKAGQVLAKIDPERPRLEVRRAEALLRKLEAELSRSRELYERKLVAADLYEKIRYDVDTQRAIYDMAKLELSYTDIVAPISGVVAQRSVKVGNLIQLNSTLFRIVDTSRLEATLNVPEREIATMRTGAPVTMQVDALGGAAFEGRIERISPVVDAGSGTFRVVCGFLPDARLRPGMFGRIGVVFDQREGVLTVPRIALLEGESEPAVYRVQDGKAVRTPVQLGYLSGEVAEILTGLSEGDRVVTTGKVALRDGALIEVIGQPAVVADDTAANNTNITDY
ncbi:efflux RND transporter periplasmic adaptor subunit [Xanthomonadaceae bacterium JHOS43]|nr:efflux RND transporter periplasmic adaptor subunit [Xanthomonadaceae bacterium JHOS43]MCX7563828.1 efflux RND transporter periplasmic adaptor subunit [Xanthomonadaceae bacterium XH05]